MAKNKKKKKKAPAQPPRRFTPNQSKRITGWLMVFGVLIAVAAINMKSTQLLLVAVAEWLVALCFMLYYWRCPECGKTLPKTGKISECPKCGAEID